MRFVFSRSSRYSLRLSAKPLVLNSSPVEYDLGRYHLPLRDFYQRCLHNGDDPAWCHSYSAATTCMAKARPAWITPGSLLYSFLPLTIA